MTPWQMAKPPKAVIDPERYSAANERRQNANAERMRTRWRGFSWSLFWDIIFWVAGRLCLS
ncbi:MAG: hypothetical protein LBK66_03985 [Spirochaetaceae bacterium]|nr:hypothetical protein [Spirochaetaceae bacterium]